MKKLSFLILFMILFISCSNKKSAEADNPETVSKDTIENAQTEQPRPNNEKYLLKENGVGLFLIGKQIPSQADGYTIEKEIRTENGEEGPYELIVYVVSEGGQEVLNIMPDYDSDYNPTDTAGEIVVLSDKYKTSEGIGVNSTIEEFLNKYSDYSIWYTYISDMYVIDTKNIKMQFLLDGADYVGKPIKIEGDMTKLKLSDFKKSAAIKKIRIF